MTRPSLAGIESFSAAPWSFQPWGGQNQNGDEAESILFDAHGDVLVYGLPNADGALIASAPTLLAAVRDVLALHAPAPVYAHIDDCGHPDDGDHGIEGDRRDEYFCPDTPTGDVLCEGCGLDEDQEPTSYPCPTIRALATRLDLTDPEGDPT